MILSPWFSGKTAVFTGPSQIHEINSNATVLVSYISDIWNDFPNS